jgi:hypothetical protein
MNPQKHANCCVLGDGSESSHHDHVKVQTPFETKKKEIMNDPQYQNKAMDSGRESKVRKMRDSGDVRPLGGNR